ncbi:ribonuclease HII [Alicyclobacillus macrosporangiidus]|uniref:ribonuclease HII n=1 Tax=Alicyclobacillus macrosporangiidus TaxID=392015 RepID=UPI0009E01605|nr:ribonuclease HII [Alicyclobacillus macrosporangiidus]MCL6598530.1 ribonuclease HII [Alicyclobacillus macrosporangiidus]
MRAQAKQAAALERARQLWAQERALVQAVSVYAGVDEAGRGALAGPVVAAAVVVDGPPERWAFVDDSKSLTYRQREILYERIVEEAVSVSVGYATVGEIDEMNILQAARLAMGRAVDGLEVEIGLVLTDGPHPPVFPSAARPALPVVDGDARCLSIAAASIVAKVVRDRWMKGWASRYPEYGFEHHAGYGTPEHLRALAEYGPTPLHRRSFAPVRRACQGTLGLL